MSIKDQLKSNTTIRFLYNRYLLLKNIVSSCWAKTVLFISGSNEYRMLKEMRKEVRSTFPLDLNLTNKARFFQGKNILGYPTMSFLLKDGEHVGWEEGRIVIDGAQLPIMQLSVDRNINFPNLFEKYKPELIVDVGTASGGTAVFFHALASRYSEPKVLSIDISEKDYVAASDFHTKNHTAEKAQFVFGKSSVDCLEEVKKFLEQRSPTQRVLVSFDDLHTYEHTFKELELYSPLLKSGDVILMQDTWNQDLYGHEVSPMLAVYRFLKEHKGEYELDVDFNKSLVLPCNFIYGVITKK